MSFRRNAGICDGIFGRLHGRALRVPKCHAIARGHNDNSRSAAIGCTGMLFRLFYAMGFHNHLMSRNFMPESTYSKKDALILELLQQNARHTNVTLARRVGLSPSACLRRVKALEEQGYIRSFVTLLDPARIGLAVSVFIQVSLEKKDEASLKGFEKAMSRRPEVMECYLMTGDSDYLLRVIVPDVASFERFLMDYLTKTPGIRMIKSSFTLKQVKYTTAMPVDCLR